MTDSKIDEEIKSGDRVKVVAEGHWEGEKGVVMSVLARETYPFIVQLGQFASAFYRHEIEKVS